MTDPHPLLPAALGWQPAATAPQTATWVQLGYPVDEDSLHSAVVAYQCTKLVGPRRG